MTLGRPAIIQPPAQIGQEQHEVLQEQEARCPQSRLSRNDRQDKRNFVKCEACLHAPEKSRIFKIDPCVLHREHIFCLY